MAVHMVPTAKKLLAEARAAKVVWSSIPVSLKYPSDAVECRSLPPTGNDPFVQSFTNKFLNTDLEKTLKDHGITTLIMTGLASNGAMLETSSEAALTKLQRRRRTRCHQRLNFTYAEQFTAWQLVNGPIISSHISLTTSDMIKF